MEATYRHITKLAAISCLCLSACVNVEKHTEDTMPEIQMTIDIDGEKGILVYDTITTVTPVLTDDDILADISKIQFSNDRFYILDSRQNQMMIFTRDGRYAGKVSNKGSGPGEYSRIADFDVATDGRLYILDTNQKKMLIYSADTLEPVSDMPLECRGLKFAVADSSNLYFENVLTGRGKRSKLVRYNSEDGKSEPILHYTINNEDKAAGKGPTHLWRSGSTIVFYDRFSTNIYSLSGTAVNIIYTLDTKNLPDEAGIQNMIDESAINPQQRDRSSSAIIRDIQDIYVTPDYTSIKINSLPPQQLFIDNSTGEVLEVAHDQRLDHCKAAAMTVAGDYFVTARHDLENDTFELVLYKLKRGQTNL